MKRITTHPLSLCAVAAAFAAAIVTVAAYAAAPEWTRFRGPDGAGVSEQTGLPTEWSDDKNIVWKTELPGPGTSSPIVVDDKIYLTCYSGYAEDVEDPGDQSDLMRHVVCLDRKSGDVAWKKDFKPDLPESRYQGNGARHGYSSSTPTSDGERLYVFFGKSGVYCFDLDGKELWHADVGSNTKGWGSANSPVLYKDALIINASIESQSLVALDKKTGKELWQTEGVRGVWNTPILVDAPGGNTELVLSLPGRPVGKIIAYDPENGEELWHAEGIPDGGYVCPSPIAHDGVVYSIGGRKNTAVAVKAGGRGDVTDSHTLWRVDKGSNVSSPVYYKGNLYWVHESKGVAYNLDAKTGEVVWQERLQPRPGLQYASAAAADGKIYSVSQHGGTYVLAAGPEFKLLAHNKLENDTSRANANIVVSNGQLLLRTDENLYCIGK